jgi:hypothetical protein
MAYIARKLFIVVLSVVTVLEWGLLGCAISPVPPMPAVRSGARVGGPFVQAAHVRGFG